MTEKPVLLLDVDGVLNLLPGWGKQKVRVTRDHRMERLWLDEPSLTDPDKPLSMQIRIPLDAPALVEQLAEHFDIHWFTMWNEDARNVFAPLAGLPDFPMLRADWNLGLDVFDALTPRPNTTLRREVWVGKTPLIEGHLGTRPWVWIDDDATRTDDWWLAKYAAVGEHLIIPVKPHEGLTQHTVDKAIAWAQAHALSEVTTP